MQQTDQLPDPFDPRKLKAAAAGLPVDQVVADASEVFKALTNPTRIRIIHALTHGLGVGVDD